MLYLDADALLLAEPSALFASPSAFAAEAAATTHAATFNAGVLWLRPSRATFDALLALSTQPPPSLFANVVDCTEQALLNLHFDGSTPERTPHLFRVARPAAADAAAVDVVEPSTTSAAAAASSQSSSADNCSSPYRSCWDSRCCRSDAAHAFGCFRRVGRRYAMCRPLPAAGACTADATWVCPGWERRIERRVGPPAAADAAGGEAAAPPPATVTHWITTRCPKPWKLVPGTARANGTARADSARRRLPTDCDSALYAYWWRVYARTGSAALERSRANEGESGGAPRHLRRELNLI